MLDQDPLAVYLVQYPVCVLFQSCCEDDHFEDLAHLLQELDSERSGFERTSPLIEMHQSLIKVEDKGVFSFLRFSTAESIHRREKI